MGIRKDERTGQYSFRNDWVEMYTGWRKGCFTFGPASYFDDRFIITFSPLHLVALIGLFFTGWSALSLIWLPIFFVTYGTIYLHLPIHSGIDICEYPQYGYYFYGESPIITSFWLCRGKASKMFDMPWAWEWVRTSCLAKDQKTWIDELKGNRKKGEFTKGFYDECWNELIFKETHPYAYNLKSGVKQQVSATIRVEQREWRWKWFQWLSFPNKIQTSIDVSFSAEIGERTGSWKGGTTGCGWTLLPNETPEQCLRRMEATRKF